MTGLAFPAVSKGENSRDSKKTGIDNEWNKWIILLPKSKYTQLNKRKLFC